MKGSGVFVMVLGSGGGLRSNVCAKSRRSLKDSRTERDLVGQRGSRLNSLRVLIASQPQVGRKAKQAGRDDCGVLDKHGRRPELPRKFHGPGAHVSGH